jgi:hypothetical protein
MKSECQEKRLITFEKRWAELKSLEPREDHLYQIMNEVPFRDLEISLELSLSGESEAA